MAHFYRCFFPLLLLPLSGCASSGSGLPWPKNGDLLSLSASDASYATVTRPLSGADIVSDVKLGTPHYVLFTGTDCSHCHDFESPFCSFVLSHGLAVDRINSDAASYASFVESVEAIKAFYPGYDWAKKFATPSLFYLSLASSSCLIYGAASASYLENFYASQASLPCGLTSFRSASLSSAYHQDHPTVPFFLYDSSPSEEAAAFYTTLLGHALANKKAIAAIDGAFLSEEDKASLLSSFTLASWGSYYLENGNAYSLDEKSEEAEARSLLASYYA